MSGLEIDFETRSDVNIKEHGGYRYFASPNTKALLASYKINGGPRKRWRYGQPCPADIAAHVAAGGMVSAHNNNFERQLWQKVLTPRNGWPELKLEQCRCTAATAAGMSLPRDLAGLGEALDLPIKKNKDGMRLIRFFSVPRLARKDEDPSGLYWNEPEDYPEKFEQFHDYCDDDVETEAAADARMVPLSEYEQDLWVIDQRINDRGIRIDARSARAALRLADKAKVLLDREMREATDKAVGAVSQVEKLVAWVQAQGVPFDSAAKADIEDLLDTDDLPPRVRRALEIRQEGAKTSVSKLRAFLKRVSADGCIRGAFLFNAAGTGRWSSVGAQLHNLPRPRQEFGDAHPDLAILFWAFRLEDPDFLKFCYGDKLGRTLFLLSDAIRGFLWAAPGYDLMVADYSGIEGAVAAWFAGEHWKVKAMHELIADPSKPDLYRRAAAGIFNTTTDLLTKKDVRRQVGKVAELSCLAASTRVLTDHGVKSITDVAITDRLWDGLEWVKHSGLIAKGVRPVVDVDGIDITPDHLILTGRTWKPAGELVSNASALSLVLAIGSANLPCPASRSARPAAFVLSRCGAPVERRSTRRPFTICFAEKARAVARAALKSLVTIARSGSDTTTSSPMTTTATGYSAVSPRASIAARTPRIEAIRTTAVAASKSFGAKTEEPFSPIWSRCRAGISQRLSLIAKMSTVIMSQVTCALLRTRLTPETNEKRRRCSAELSNSKRKMPVFDLLNAGPRNRFTVFSRSGALIVHNCQYQGGVGAFRSMARNYSLKLAPVFDIVWPIASAERQAAAVKRYETCVKRGEATTKQLSRKAWLAAELVKIGWRATHPAICDAWKLLETGIREAIESPGQNIQVLKVVFRVDRGFLWCKLPSGRCLAYGKPRLKEQVWARRTGLDASEVMARDLAEAMARKGELKIESPAKSAATALGVNSVTKKWERFALYGGLAFENIVQAIARDLLANGIKLAEEHGYPVIGHVHDEIICEVLRGFGDLDFFSALICRLPAVYAGLPLAAHGWRGKRYRKD